MIVHTKKVTNNGLTKNLRQAKRTNTGPAQVFQPLYTVTPKQNFAPMHIMMAAIFIWGLFIAGF